MTKDEHERELQLLYRASNKNDDVQLSLDILGQLHHYGYDLPPLEVPDDLCKTHPRSIGEREY